MPRALLKTYQKCKDRALQCTKSAFPRLSFYEVARINKVAMLSLSKHCLRKSKAMSLSEQMARVRGLQFPRKSYFINNKGFMKNNLNDVRLTGKLSLLFSQRSTHHMFTAMYFWRICAIDQSGQCRRCIPNESIMRVAAVGNGQAAEMRLARK